MLILIGVTVGLFIGAMPGLGSVNGVAILLPITFLVPPGSAIIFLAAIYYGAMYGGAISSITLGIPGASTAVATTFDGRPLAMQGRASLALVTAALASPSSAGRSRTCFFTLFAPLLATVALSFGPPEIFALMLLAFATFVGLGGDDIPKTIFSICFGLVLGAVGLRPDLGRAAAGPVRHERASCRGISFLVLAIGVYGIGEMLWTIEQTRGEVRRQRRR
jgi:putative tricarboxylic transport membrane protein